MIKKLRRRFIVLAVAALFALLAVLVTGMNIINYCSVLKEADGILSILSRNKGDFPRDDRPNDLPSGEQPTEPDGQNKPQPLPGLSPEAPYESRYFSVLLDADGNALYTDTKRIAAVDEQTAVEYAQTADADGKETGFLGVYRYIRSAEPEGTRIVFLDCSRSLDAFRSFFTASVGIALAGFAVVSLLFALLAGRIVQPIAESYEKQKRFITDAGHEIKTPLTIIRANTDLLEMELGENESLHDIRTQAERLTALTNDLVTLSRMEESAELPKVDFPLSEVVSEAAADFRAPARAHGQTLVCNITPMLTLHGDSASLAKLVALLLDNALKYAPDGSTVTLTLARSGKNTSLCVENPTLRPLERETLPHLFDRFYRADASRNSGTGGYGIGLSVAKAIVTAQGGKIQATMPDGNTFRITATFPA